jgi:hypothetical protein
MTSQDCVPYRAEILRHFDDGAGLRPEARAHYAGCVHCMTAVTAALSGKTNGLSPDGHGAAARTPTAVPDAARRALAHGNQVLGRVFGIRAPSGPVTPE